MPPDRVETALCRFEGVLLFGGKHAIEDTRQVDGLLGCPVSNCSLPRPLHIARICYKGTALALEFQPQALLGILYEPHLFDAWTKPGRLQRIEHFAAPG